MEASDFLKKLLEARSPTGAEQEAQAVVDSFVQPLADAYEKDVLGNRLATLNPSGDPVVMLAGHIDELGLIVKHVDDRGFVYFDTLGGHDPIMISGRRVTVLTQTGGIPGVTGKRAIHLMDQEDRKKVPKIHDIWIDIGAKTREEALERVQIGDPVVYDMGFQMIHGSVATARAFDDKVGAYAVLETLRRLSQDKVKLDAKLISVATTQEEIGTRGATTAAWQSQADFGVAVDVGHATDHPDCDPKKHGKQALGGGPILARGPNVNPIVFDRLVQCARQENIEIQIEAEPRPLPTDARVMQMARAGMAMGMISIPLRYMHTPSEMIDLQDVESTVRLLMAFVKSLRSGERGIF